ncbi:branched-chain amino acid ABC transporter permease [Actinoplanes teichomyceticus]|uniref:Amino acid/amide ABC transporter membrane protein 2 (HAAT family) n=1 Tax=Actinoplanes teichomyceticus TaxID=1867 RepID=A0A561WBR2_ACTTI|nr:branched-chain amino acid ABC transporter permease [Actinoplanes teichomyceticus]TWG21285.1 amino acid/amide ABC transporter membrane protein 2 (HAAT family) [Actinoplanes teichomyceticus]GIF16702.1 branched-chain amino acid ABC transporter permease [Actinoplanes teichomyceticus]
MTAGTLTTLARRPRWLAPATSVVTVGALAAGPFLLLPYATATLTRMLVFGLLAASLSVLVGLAGTPSLGHAAFFGAGAYATAWTAVHQTSTVLALCAGTLVAAVLAALVGAVAVRTHGVWFLMFTLAVGELLQQTADSWEPVTGGSNGLYGIPALAVGPLVADGPATTYWFVLIFFVLGMATLWAVATSSFGTRLRAVRDSEDRMRALGHRATAVKWTAFLLAGAVAGLAGGLFAAQQRLVTPADLGFSTSALALLAVVIGGSGSLWGPVLGAALVIAVRDVLGADLDGHGPLALGLLFVLVVYLLPGGFLRPRGAGPRPLPGIRLLRRDQR